MPFHIDIVGVAILLIVIASSRIIVVIRTVQSIKYHAHLLLKEREDAIQNKEYSVHYAQAHETMYGLQRDQLEHIRKSFWGKILSRIVTKKFYEIP
jgi:hypothetical protein